MFPGDRWIANSHGMSAYAAVAELADAHDSGSCARKGVVVRLHSAALKTAAAYAERRMGDGPFRRFFLSRATKADILLVFRLTIC